MKSSNTEGHFSLLLNPEEKKRSKTLIKVANIFLHFTLLPTIATCPKEGRVL
jgi:hypothetical protein